jgi:hypothetical protein
LVDGDASYTEALGDLGQTDRLAVVHAPSVSKVLTEGQRRTDNPYMTENEPWCPDHGYGCEPSSCPCGHTIGCDCWGIANER